MGGACGKEADASAPGPRNVQDWSRQQVVDWVSFLFGKATNARQLTHGLYNAKAIVYPDTGLLLCLAYVIGLELRVMLASCAAICMRSAVLCGSLE